MKTTLTIFLALSLISCVFPDKVGFLVLRNDTNQIVHVKGRFIHQKIFEDESAINPKKDMYYSQYEIRPGTEDTILDQFAEIEVRIEQCIVTVDQKSMRANTSYEGVSVIINITDKLISNCN